MREVFIFFMHFYFVATLYSQIQQTVNLSYQDYTGKQIPNANYTGVRVGEYYWMNNNFNTPAGPMPNTKEGIDLIHQRYVMFNFNKFTPDRNDPTYWSYFEKKGMSIDDVMSEFNKYYGQYYAVRPAVTTGVHYGKMRENGILNGSWELPDNEDVLQLIGMCGTGSLSEVRQYLCFNETDQITPSFVKIEASKYPYYYWFRNGTDPKINNKYKLNFVPAGWKYDRPFPYFQITENYGKIVYFTASYGDFIGLNQVLSIPTKRCLLDVHDYVEMKYLLLMQSFPVRFCRKLTDNELGYKLYISIEGNKKGLKYPQKMLYMYDWPGKDFPLFRTSEEQILDYVKQGILHPSEVKIVKLDLNKKPAANYYELDRGYLRGLYVQYILDGNGVKSIADIIDVAIRNPRLWLVNRTGKITIKSEEENTQNLLQGGIYELKYSNGVFDIPTTYVMSLDELNLIDLPIPNTYTITEISPPYNCKKSKTQSITISFNVGEINSKKDVVFKNRLNENDPTNINEGSVNNELSICPNPTSNTLDIICPNDMQLVELYNLNGAKLYSDNKHENEKSIDINYLPIGIYVLYLKYGKKEMTYKFTKR